MSADRIRFEGAWKAYPRWDVRTLREAVGRRMPGVLGPGEQRWALRDISLTVGRGEFVGVVGQNGAGKSTLLRLAAGLTAPTRGRVLLPAETSAVLSLGDLFDLVLSGRENAMTTAVAAGLSPRRAREIVPHAIEFAELEGFEDAPLRTYSDGMRLRLAFGVMAQLEPDALLLDEVIAVGDLRFQEKCVAYVRERCERGAGVLFASHSLEQIAQECGRVVWLEAGGIRALGEAEEVVAAYREAMHSETRERTPAPDPGATGELELRRNRFGTQEATIHDVELRDGAGRPAAGVATGGSLEVTFVVRAPAGRPVPAPIAGVAIATAEDHTICYDANTRSAGVALGEVEGELRVSLAIERLDLVPGEYFVDVGIYEGDWRFAYDFHWRVYPLTVLGEGGGGLVRLPARWRVGAPAGSSASR